MTVPDGASLSTPSIKPPAGVPDVLAAAGRSDGQMLAVNINTNTHLTSVAEFSDLIIKYQLNIIFNNLACFVIYNVFNYASFKKT